MRTGPDEAFQAKLAEVEHLASKSFPLLGHLLDEVETWWAERDFEPSRKACLARLRELIAAR
jgi:hypothetical protein